MKPIEWTPEEWFSWSERKQIRMLDRQELERQQAEDLEDGVVYKTEVNIFLRLLRKLFNVNSNRS